MTAPAGTGAPQGPAGSGIVVNAAPITVTAGTPGSTPYPTNTAAQLHYALVQNSTPFTLQISQGLVLGQVPAFTAQVFVLATTGQPLSYVPVAGSGIIAPGTDSTLYVTWSQFEPYGTWPAAIGSGAVPFNLTNLLFSGTVATPGFPGAAIVSPGIFSTKGFGSLALSVQNQTGGAGQNIGVIVSWFADAAGLLQVGYKAMVVGPLASSSGFGGWVYPNLGDYCAVTVFTQAASAAGTFLVMELRSGTESLWSQPPSSAIVNSTAFLLGPLSQAIGGPGNATFTARSPYEGPAQVFAGWGFAAAAFNDWRITLNAVDDQGNVLRIADWQATPAIQSAVNEEVILPPYPIQMVATNNTGAGHTVFASITADNSRFG